MYVHGTATQQMWMHVNTSQMHGNRTVWADTVTVTSHSSSNHKWLHAVRYKSIHFVWLKSHRISLKKRWRQLLFFLHWNRIALEPECSYACDAVQRVAFGVLLTFNCYSMMLHKHKCDCYAVWETHRNRCVSCIPSVWTGEKKNAPKHKHIINARQLYTEHADCGVKES